MLPNWVLEETKDVHLGDQRLNDRMRLILDQLSAAPAVSIPAACGGYAEMAAAYRFFDNDKVHFDNVLDPHVHASRRRIAGQERVLLVQDTTEIDLTRPNQQVRGAGTLDGSSRFGMFLHPLMGFTPDGTPLGIVHAKVWNREEKPQTSQSMTRSERAQIPIEQKESMRWVEALRAAGELAAQVPGTRLLMVADSESDIYEVLEETSGAACGYILRACQDRAVVSDDWGEARLRAEVLKAPVLTIKTIAVWGRKARISTDQRSRRQSRNDRMAVMEVRSTRVTLRPPSRPDRTLSEVTLNVVLASEVNPPAEEPAIEWLLLTSEPVQSADEALGVLEDYTLRWMIEVFFRVLKSGCRIEERRFETVDRVLPALALSLIVGWRTLYLCRLGRAFPDLDCEALFEPSEWKAVYRVVTGKWPPQKPPKLKARIRLVARLGGFADRKENEPGPQTLWLGLQRAHDMAQCWDIFGPGTGKDRDV